MGNLGAGTGSSYPASLDYQSTPEVNSPSAGMTKARAQVPNDLAAAVVAIQTELGTDPAGTTTDVKTFLQAEHETDGTHGAITTASVITSTVATGTAPFVVSSTTVVANLQASTVATIPITPYAKISDVKANGFNGGSSSAGTWHVRTLNTEDNDSAGIVSLSSNQITLQSGTYRISASAPCGSGDLHRAALYNVTDSAYALLGSSDYARNSPLAQNRSFVVGEITIAAQKTFELRHFIQSTYASYGLGYAVSSGVDEVYSIVEIWKIA